MFLKKIGFWIVWILLCPIVFGYYVVSDIRHKRWKYPTAWLKTGLVRQSVWQELFRHKK
ncbi:hypothetical protein [Salmonirosea aquatica]|uniref:hypothetical protein n=1 Tax=Salmonirosea aquatica TaxID=2654236 RepID=UPI0035710F59